VFMARRPLPRAGALLNPKADINDSVHRQSAIEPLQQNLACCATHLDPIYTNCGQGRIDRRGDWQIIEAADPELSGDGDTAALAFEYRPDCHDVGGAKQQVYGLGSSQDTVDGVCSPHEAVLTSQEVVRVHP